MPDFDYFFLFAKKYEMKKAAGATGKTASEITDPPYAPNEQASGGIIELRAEAMIEEKETAIEALVNIFLTPLLFLKRFSIRTCVPVTEKNNALETSMLQTKLIVKETPTAATAVIDAQTDGSLSLFRSSTAEYEVKTLLDIEYESNAITNAAQRSTISPPNKSCGGVRRAFPQIIEASVIKTRRI